MAATISQYGDQLTTVALLVLLYQVTGSIQAPAGYLLAKQIPRMVGTPFGGDLADRFSPQRILVACSLAQGATVLAILVAGDRGSAVAIYVLVVAGQLAAGMARAATGAVMPRVVAPDRLARANALYQLSWNSSFVGAPLIGAPLLAWKGPNALLLIDIASFLITALLVMNMPSLVDATEEAAPAPAGPLGGLRAVLADPVLSVTAISFLAEGIVVNVAASIFVLLATERLGGNGDVALLYLFVGVGDAAGALLLLRLKPVHVTPMALLVPALVSVGSIGFLVFAHSLWSAALPLFVCGGAAIVFQTWGVAEAQRTTSREVMGRVSAVFHLASTVGLMLGAGAQIILLGLTRWDVTLTAVSAGTLLLLALSAALAGRTRTTTHVGPAVTAPPPAG